MTLSDPEINTKKKNKYFNWFQLKTSSKLSDLFQSYASELISFFLSMPAFFLHRETEMKPHFWPFLPLLRDSFLLKVSSRVDMSLKLLRGMETVLKKCLIYC